MEEILHIIFKHNLKKQKKGKKQLNYKDFIG